MTDITLIQGLKLIDRWKPHKEARLYYFEGNFYWPFLSLDGSQVGRIKGAIRRFSRDNQEMIDRDRSAPGYKTIPELFDIQEKEFANG